MGGYTSGEQDLSADNTTNGEWVITCGTSAPSAPHMGGSPAIHSRRCSCHSTGQEWVP